MREWILQNTAIKESEYDSTFNLDTVLIGGKSNSTNEEEDPDNPMINIARFTFAQPSFFRRKKFKIKKIKEPNKRHYYLYQKIKFYVLGEIFPIMEQETFSIRRISACFYINSEICLLKNINTKLITAMCTSPYFKTKKKYVHTFVLLTASDNSEYILDGTNNTIMDKDSYFSIFHPEIITCIDKEKLKKDLDLLKPFEEKKQIFRAEYLCFPEETIKAAKKRIRKRRLFE